MKKMLLKGIMACAVLCSVCMTASAQVEAKPNTVVKLSHWAFVGIVNPAVEMQVSEHWSVQLEGIGSFYRKAFLGTDHPMMMGNGFLDLRYYFKESLRGLYVGPNVGYGVWKLNQNMTPGYNSDEPNIKESYSVGCNVMGGLSLGWQFTFGAQSRWGLDINYTLGGHKAWFDSFRKVDDLLKAQGRKTTSGFLPAYKGGVFLSYRF